MSSDRAAELASSWSSSTSCWRAPTFVTIHAPLTPETKNMFERCGLRENEERALLVNAARGGIVDEEALARAITEGKIAAPPSTCSEGADRSRSPAARLDNVLCTPHLEPRPRRRRSAWRSKSPSKPSATCSKRHRHERGQRARAPQEIAERLTPYLDVARALGSLVGQLDPIDVRELRVTCTGEAGELASRRSRARPWPASSNSTWKSRSIRSARRTSAQRAAFGWRRSKRRATGTRPRCA